MSGKDTWTANLLKKLVDERDKRYEQRFTDQEKSVSVAMSAAEKASNKAEQLTKERLATHNDLQAKMEEQTRNFVTRESVDERFESFDKSLVNMKERLDRGDGRGVGLHAGWVLIVGGLAAGASVIGMMSGLVALWKAFH
jgi:hypothetical protein